MDKHELETVYKLRKICFWSCICSESASCKACEAAKIGVY
jgi:hypothetical protein